MGSNKKRKKVKKKSLGADNKIKIIVIILVVMLVLGLTAAGVGYAVVRTYIDELDELDLTMLDPATTSYLYDKDEKQFADIYSDQNRIKVPLDVIPEHVQNAFIAIEDERFHEHVGFDIKAIGRAFVTNLRRQRTAQGGSTITQQLVKNAFLTPERDYKRKVQEVYLAYQLERQFHKDEILELYLNWIYFDYSTNGVEAAAQMLFDKSISDVTLAEAALMAGIPNNPSMFSPYRNMDGAKSRQALILNKMLELEMINESEYTQAKNTEIVMLRDTEDKEEDEEENEEENEDEETQSDNNAEILIHKPPTRTPPYFSFYEYVVHTELRRIIPEIPELSDYNTYLGPLYSGGLHIYTTLDTELQEFAEDVVNNADNYPTTIEDELGKLHPQANVVLAEPETGLIRVLVGGRDQGSHNQLLRFDVGRDTGSAIKPISTYAPAFEEGVITTATPLDDAPLELRATDGMFRPENVDRRFRGLVGMRDALAHSHNIPALRVFQELGVSKGIEYAKKFGLESLVDPPGEDGKHDHGVGATLGGLTKGVTTLEMVKAFSTLANQGVKLNMATVTRIEDSSGRVLYEHKPEVERIVSSETAYIITDILIDSVRFGTGTRFRIDRTMAAKTGTSDNQRTGYTVAYTRDYVMGYWIGYDIPADGTIPRAFLYAPNFINPIMRKAHEGLSVRNFVRPGNIVSASICQKSGLRPGPNCPDEDITTELFVRGTVPTEECDMHITMLVCAESELLPSEFCPEHILEERVFLNRPEYITTTSAWKRGGAGRYPADAEQMPPTEEEICDIHTERPEPPKNLSFKLENGAVTLQWASPDNDIEGYLVFRQAQGEESFIRLTENPIESLSYVDANVQEERTYIYRVLSMNEAGVFSEGAAITVEVPKKVEEYTLTVNASPSEGGSVSGGGSYPAGSNVDIEASPSSAEWKFVKWEGPVEKPNDRKTKVRLDANTTVTAVFEREQQEVTEYTLTIQKTGEGSINLGVGDHTYEEGETVSLSAEAAEGWEFDKWDGANIGNPNESTITVTMDRNRTITAIFKEIIDEEDDG